MNRIAVAAAVLAVSASGFAGDDPTDLSPSSMPGDVYVLDEQYLSAIVEAEKLPGSNSSSWVHETSATRPQNGTNYLGDGFVRYVGPTFTGVHPDANHTRQGDKETWLVFKVRIPSGQGGLYKMLVRKSHILEDGDNDCWIGYIGMPSNVPIGRYGWGARETFSWGNMNMEDNPDGFQLNAGLNAVFVAGRSKNFCVDRIAIYKAQGGNASYARNINAPESLTEGEVGVHRTRSLSVQKIAVPRASSVVSLLDGRVVNGTHLRSGVYVVHGANATATDLRIAR